ncbi:MAG: class I SAM-dependent methyltransferase [Candidatus Pacebacteria bacterium]|nr:class I SAM-dependent methyltransferase [Candidatus Paceibacterota bacterium]
MEKPSIYTNEPEESHSYERATLAPSYLKILDALGLSSESVVLEFGAGAGHEASYMRESTGATVVELDTTPAAYEAQPDSKRNFVIGSYEQLPYATNSFSVIHSKDALVHIEDKKALFKEFSRVLKPGGTLLLTTEDRNDLDSLKFNMARKRGGPAMRAYFITPKKKIESFLDDAGFKPKQTSSWKPRRDEVSWYDLERMVFFLENTKES